MPLPIPGKTLLLLALVLLLFGARGCISRESVLGQCGQDEGRGDNTLYVSTLDGSITALDSHGQRQWVHQLSHPLFSSTLSYAKPTTEIPNLIPGLDKHLYHWDGSLLTKLPLTADNLVEKDYSDGPASVRSGARSKEDIGLSLSTGKPLYRCTHHSCEKYDGHSQISRTDLLLVSSHRTVVREAAKLTGDELWNFTVAQVFLSMVEGELGEEEKDVSCQVEDFSDWTVHTDASQDLLYATNSVLGISWNYKFSSPVEGVWMLQGGKLQEIPLSSASSVTLALGPVLMLGVYRNQYYIQPMASLGEIPGIGGAEHPIVPPPHYLLSLPPSSPALLDSIGKGGVDAGRGEAGHALTLYKEGPRWDLHTYGPKGLAVYFQPWKMPGDLESTCSSGEENASEDDYATPTPSPSVPMETPSFWARNFELGKTVLQYGVFAVIVLIVNKVRRSQMQSIRQRLNSGGDAEPADGELSPEEFSSSDRYWQRHGSLISNSSSSATLRPTGSTFLLPIVEEGEDLHPKEHRSKSTESSRFETDYEIQGRLGRGGFGVVHHVKNRVDGREYALKRIKLPVKKFARDKVMREVHALAQLDHPQIVRYFYSWVEQAPPGWDQREEWVPLSRVSSLLHMEEQAVPVPSPAPISPTTPLIPNGGSFPLRASSSPVLSASSTSSPNAHHFGESATLFTISDLPPLRSLSRSSSFTIDFLDESSCKVSNDEQAHSQESATSTGSEDNVTASETNSIAGSKANSNVGAWTSDNSSFARHVVCGDSVEPPTFLFIQMQLCQKETLKDWLRNNIYNRQRSVILSIFQQTLSAVLYVHSKGLMHRDLKPSNIFFALDGSVKVGDFGLVTDNVSLDTHNHSFLNLKHLASLEDQFGSSGQRHTGNIGTHFYVSPEQRQGLRYDQKVDIFSLGVILFELNFPFKTEMERSRVLEDIRRSKFPKKFREHMKQEAQLVEWLISPVERRPTAAEVHSSDQLQHLGDLIKFSDFTYVPTM